MKEKFFKNICRKGTAVLLGLVLCFGNLSVPAEAAAVTKIIVAGADRCATSEAAAAKRLNLQGKSKTNVLFLASSTSFPDALSCVSLVKSKDAVLLLHSNRAEEPTLTRIGFYLNSGGTVYILGGSAAVPYSMDSKITARGYTVKRLEGSNRYETNLVVLREAYGDERTSRASLNTNDLLQTPDTAEAAEEYADTENASTSENDGECSENAGSDENVDSTASDTVQSDDTADLSDAALDEASCLSDSVTDLNGTDENDGSEESESTSESISESLPESIPENDSESSADKDTLTENDSDGISEEMVPQEAVDDLNTTTAIPRLLVCSGGNFPDALSASATGLPILITRSALDAQQRTFLSSHSIGSIDVIGGSEALPDSLMTDLKRYTSGSVQRVAGSTRYTTSIEVAKRYFPSTPTTAALARGTNFPDALSSGQITSLLNVPLILTAPGYAQSANDYLRDKVKTVYVFGGELVMPEWNVRQAVGELPGYTARACLGNNKSGGKTLKNLIQNALIPAGRTLYVYGGGWGDDAEKIGYLSGWDSFFKTYGNASYDRKQFEYTRFNGVDCSGYMAWVVYNTMNTRNDQGSILYGNGTAYTAVKFANRLGNLGYASFRSGQVKSFSQLKPGDIVSMSGHVWMCLGTCSDGSALILHSSPMGQTYGGGVQLCGTGSTSSQSYKLAKMYNDIYFPYWPYPTLVVSDSYLTSSVGFARWNNDPDGLRNMTANQVMTTLIGPV